MGTNGVYAHTNFSPNKQGCQGISQGKNLDFEVFLDEHLIDNAVFDGL